MTKLFLIAFVLTLALATYLYVWTTLASSAAKHITGTEFGRYIDLCRAHGLQLAEANLPDKTGDESFRTFSLTRGGVTRTLRPQETLQVLRVLEVGDTDRAFAILKMA